MSETQTKLLSATPATTTIGTGEYLAKVDANGQVTRISLADLRAAVVSDDIPIKKGTIRNFNQALTPGMYFITGWPTTAENAPSGIYGYGILEVSVSNPITLQKYTSHHLGVAIRIRYGENWTDWRTLFPDTTI